MTRIATTILCALTSALLVVPTVAMAQEEEKLTEYVPQSTAAPDETRGKKQGIDGTLQAAATANLIDNRNVVGQTDGLGTLLGLGILSSLDYVSGNHELLNTLNISESFSRTPTLPEFVKSDDSVNFESLYHYFFVSWMGAFARVSADTALFATNRLTPEPVDYAISRPDGEVEVRQNIERLLMSESFQPLTAQESVGIFAEPIRETALQLNARAGFGLRETWAQGVLVEQDDDTTPAVIEIVDISNPDSNLTVFQGGLEGFLGVGGKLQGNKLTYDVGSTILVPFINNDSQDRSATELTRVGLAASLGFAVFEWLSLNYKFRYMRDPQLLDAAQVQNNLLVTFNYTFIEPAEIEEAPEPTEAEIRAEAAEQRAAEAERRAAELEARIEDLQASPDPAPLPEAPEPQPEPTPEPTPEP